MSSPTPLSTTLLSNEHLHCRDFGSALLDVDCLNEWIAAKRLRLPIRLDGNFVQVEWLLAAIQRSVQVSVTEKEASEIVLANARLSGHRCAASNPAWLLGGEAFLQWAALVRQGINDGELTLLDFSSKLPIQTEEPKEDAPTKPWASRARTMAAVLIAEALAAKSVPTKAAVSTEIARLFRQEGILTEKRRPIESEYIERHALKNWTHLITQEKRKLQA